MIRFLSVIVSIGLIGCSSPPTPSQPVSSYSAEDVAALMAIGQELRTQVAELEHKCKTLESRVPGNYRYADDFENQGYAGGELWVEEKDLIGVTKFGRRFPRIIIDGRKLIYSPTAECDGGYLDHETGVPVAWQPGDDLRLMDVQLQADQCADPSVALNDIVFYPAVGELNIVDHKAPDSELFGSRPLRIGDKIHRAAAKYLCAKPLLTIDRDAGVCRIGQTDLWAKFEGDGDWEIADKRTFTRTQYDTIYDGVYQVAALGKAARKWTAEERLKAFDRALNTAPSMATHAYGPDGFDLPTVSDAVLLERRAELVKAIEAESK